MALREAARGPTVSPDASKFRVWSGRNVAKYSQSSVQANKAGRTISMDGQSAGIITMFSFGRHQLLVRASKLLLSKAP